MRTYQRILILITFIVSVITVSAQNKIGGNPTPLYYSTHTYQIPMSEEGNNFSWELYPGELSSADVDAGGHTPLVSGTDYYVSRTDKTDDGKAFITVRFAPVSQESVALKYKDDTNTGKYTLVYMESTTGANVCQQNVIYNFVLMAPIDVDVVDIADDCPDSSGVPQFNGSQSLTSVTYDVELKYPKENPSYEGTEWNFTFKVNVESLDGTAAKINSVKADGESVGTGINSTSYQFDRNISAAQTECEIVVEYIDVLGATQNITVELLDITGSYNERDDDDINKTTGNIVTHTINAMPSCGNIFALN